MSSRVDFILSTRSRCWLSVEAEFLDLPALVRLPRPWSYGWHAGTAHAVRLARVCAGDAARGRLPGRAGPDLSGGYPWASQVGAHADRGARLDHRGGGAGRHRTDRRLALTPTRHHV